jgi:hypothetical protein
MTTTDAVIAATTLGLVIHDRVVDVEAVEEVSM